MFQPSQTNNFAPESVIETFPFVLKLAAAVIVKVLLSVAVTTTKTPSTAVPEVKSIVKTSPTATP